LEEHAAFGAADRGSPTSSITRTVGAVKVFIFVARLPSMDARTRVRQRLSAVVK
jgi:hypothetical protein